MTRSVGTCLLVVLTLVLGGTALPTRAAPQSWRVIAGGVNRDGAVWSNAYHPRRVEIGVGDTLTWQFDGFHTVTFLGGEPFPEIIVPEGQRLFGNPRVFFPVGGKTYDGTGYVNSGTPPEGQIKGGVYSPAPFSYSLTFTKAGEYRYVCTIHGPGMGGTVRVTDSPTSSPAAVLRQAREDQQATLRAGRAAYSRLRPEGQGRSIVVPLPGNLRAGYSIFRFTRAPLVVRRGTTVTWTMRDPFEIHTVTFPGGQQPPPFIIPQPQSQGPPKLLLNPKVAMPTKTPVHRGAGYVNLGILFPPGVPGNPPTSYRLTFTKTGRYEYWCSVHVPEGMKGTVIVQ
ncbi:MAG: cupredoxin domain-containing protein [Armatimonadota bacterium]